MNLGSAGLTACATPDRETLNTRSGPFLAHEVSVLVRLSVALNRNRSYGIVGSRSRQACEAHTELVLLELHFLAGRQQARGLHLRHHAADRGRFARPEVVVHVER